MCRVGGCTTEHSPDQLACRKHWFQLPKDVRDRIWDLYRNGPEDEHREACFAALKSLEASADPAPVLHRGLDRGECRSCGTAIVWALTINGKKSPFVEDPQGFFVMENGYAVHKGSPPAQLELGAPAQPQRFTNHFASCEQADSWRKPR